MDTEKQEKKDYEGHRKRLKERFLKDLGASMPEYELLELLLTYCLPRSDVKPRAKKLISTFGSISELLSASDERLKQADITDNMRAFLRLVSLISSMSNWRRLNGQDKPVLSNQDYVIDYCRSRIPVSDVEEFHVIFLNAGLTPIEDKLMQKGTVDAVFVHPREILKQALNNGATSVILYHNHPGGRCRPSKEDIFTTSEIAKCLSAAEIKVLDHIVLTKSEHFSFRENGLIDIIK